MLSSGSSCHCRFQGENQHNRSKTIGLFPGANANVLDFDTLVSTNWSSDWPIIQSKLLICHWKGPPCCTWSLHDPQWSSFKAEIPSQPASRHKSQPKRCSPKGPQRKSARLKVRAPQTNRWAFLLAFPFFSHQKGRVPSWDPKKVSRKTRWPNRKAITPSRATPVFVKKHIPPNP